MFFYPRAIGKNDKRIKASTVKSSETGKKKEENNLEPLKKAIQTRQMKKREKLTKVVRFEII